MAKTKSARGPLTAILLAAGLLAATHGSAAADTYRTTRFDDPPPNGCKPRDCSLREAVLKANRRDGRDVIVLKHRLRREYTLAREGDGEDAARTGDLDLTSKTAIKASGRRRASINAEGIDGVFDVRRGAQRFDGLVIRGGDSPRLFAAGGIFSKRRVVVVDSSVRNNVGGIDARVLNMKRSSVARNAGLRGVVARRAAIEDSRIVRNVAGDGDLVDGGGLFICSRLRMTRSVISHNTSPGEGAGGVQFGDLDSSSPGCDDIHFVISRSLIEANASTEGAGGAGSGTGFNDGTIRTTTIAGNSGAIAGGLELNGPTISRSSVIGNSSSSDGGGLRSPGGDIVNSTIAHNSAAGSGGGVHTCCSNLRLRSTTIAYNEADSDGADGGSGGGLFSRPTGRTAVANSLIALNSVGASGSDPQCAGEFVSRGGNFRSSSDPGCTGFEQPTDIVEPQPRIGELSDNGGPTPTIRLLKGSPAIGAARRKTSPNRDQRGVRRDRRPDIGAFERR